MKVTDKRSPLPNPVITASDIPMGGVFTGSITGRKGVFVKSYYGIVMLDEPKTTWSGPNVGVHEYRSAILEVVLTTPDSSCDEF